MASRRGQGSGAIYRTKSGKWEAVLDLGYVTDPKDGKKKRKRVKRKRATEGAAIKALDEIKRQHHLGTLQQGKSPRLANYLQEWFDTQGTARWKPTSIRAHKKSLRYCMDALGHLRLDQLRAGHVEDMLNSMAETYARNTIIGALAVLRMAMKDAVRDGLVIRNVASEARMPRHVEKGALVTRFMTTEELQRFLRAAHDHTDGVVCAVAVLTGLRIGEVRGLRWQDVDLDAGMLKVEHQLQDNAGGGWRLTTPKTDSSVRTLPLPIVAVDELKRQYRHQLEDRLLAGEKWQDHDFIFTAQRGQPMPADRIRKTLRDVLKAAGVDGLRFHDLRHSFASFLISQGADPVAIKTLMGHKTIQTTLNTYAKLFPDKKAEVMATWDTLKGIAS